MGIKLSSNSIYTKWRLQCKLCNFSKKILCVLVASIFLPLYGNADTIFLKDGKKIEADKVWEENGQVKYRSYGAVVGYPKERVEKVERSGDDQEKSFKFDIWTFGMTVRQVFDVAEINDVPLRRAGIISVNDHYCGEFPFDF